MLPADEEGDRRTRSRDAPQRRAHAVRELWRLARLQPVDPADPGDSRECPSGAGIDGKHRGSDGPTRAKQGGCTRDDLRRGEDHEDAGQPGMLAVHPGGRGMDGAGTDRRQRTDQQPW